jgi:mannose/cellobiose epimerase-like protein (N-acyl-D-glucosamine 2-epimerase family)
MAPPASRCRTNATGRWRARQLYVFATAGNLTHADTLFAALQRHFGDGAGGWIYSIDADGQPLDTTRDLYTHAFVVFACAHYHRAGGSAAALDLLRRTVDVIESALPMAAGCITRPWPRISRPMAAACCRTRSCT